MERREVVVEPESVTSVPGLEPAEIVPATPVVAAADSTPACANCGTVLAGPFCSNCGQHVADFHQSVWRLATDFIENTFGWDSKALRTLALLFRQPGFLTREYMAGRRARYVQPLRLFLFTSAVCITLWHIGGDDRSSRSTRHKHDAKSTSAAHEAATPKKDHAADPDQDADTDTDTPAPSPTAARPSPTIPPQAAAVLAGLGIPVPGASATPSPETGASVSPSPGGSPEATPSVEQIKAEVRDALKGKLGDKNAGAVTDLGEQIGRSVKDSVAKNGGVEGFSRNIAENFRQRLSWVALGLLPVFALMLRGLYWRKDMFYFLHLIFSLHYHTFLLVFWTAHNWLGALVGTGLAKWSLLLVPVYLYLALRRVYGDSVRRTWMKVIVLSGMHLLALTVGLGAIGAMAFFSTVR